MSDREIIIGSLQNVQKQLQRNALILEMSFGLSLLLLFPVAFKILDLFRPFHGWTVITVFTLWLIAVAGFAVRKWRKKDTLSAAAASIDKRAVLNDEMKTAYWFVTGADAGRHSPDWVALQVQRAANHATRLNIGQLYPRVLPPWFYTSIGLIALWIGLNFIPFTGNHNWLEMQAAPAFSLTAQQQALLNETKKLLAKAEKLDNTAVANELQKFISDLEGGKMGPEQALSQLKNMQDELNQGKLDMGQINDGLNEIAQDLESSKETSDIANELQNRDLNDAASDMKSLSDKIQNASPDDLKQMTQSLSQAGQESQTGLQNLTKDLAQAAANLQNQNQQGVQSALNQASKDIQDLAKKMESQSLKDAASQDLQNLQDSLKQDGGQKLAQDQSPNQAQGQGKSGGKSGGSQSPGSAGQQGQQQQSGADSQNSGQSGDGKNAQPPQNSDGSQAQDGTEQQKGMNPADAKPQAGSGGLMTSGKAHAPLQLMGAPTKLDVQLEKEQVDVQASPGGTPGTKEEASKQERSTLDYRNVPSDLTPAQKDVLNQDEIPWEYRNLIKNYFQAIRPAGKP